MTGQYAHTIDAKGRLFIPAKLREELGDTFYVTMGMDSCLSIYSDASWARFTEKFESLPYTKTKAMRPLFANAAKCEPDAQGRIVLPQKVREKMGFAGDLAADSEAAFAGFTNRFRLYRREVYDAELAEDEDDDTDPLTLVGRHKRTG